MKLFYLDSSAWLKRFFDEPGSSWVRGLFEQKTALASASLGYVEVSAALARQQMSRKMNAEEVKKALGLLDAQWRDFFQVGMDDEIVSLAVGLAREKRLRGGDAIHLAAVTYLVRSRAASPGSVVFVVADVELASAAVSLGLTVVNPEN